MLPIFIRLSKLDLERIWVIWAAFAVLWSLFGIVLAQIREFRPPLVGVATVLAGLGGWFFGRIERRFRGTERSEGLWPLAPILIAAGLLFSWPAEHFPLLGDSAIYPNTAAVLIRTGGLETHYAPLDGLTLEQKQLFYIPADRQIPGFPIRSYQGLLYGAYYVMDPERNLIVSSRQPLMIIWMGAFGWIAGPRGMLYVSPLFGVAGLATVYFLGKRVFDRRAGALAALWLLLSFPQMHFSRASYAEAAGQFFVLAGLYGLTRALQTGWVGYGGLGIAAWAAAFAARVEVLLALPALGFFLAGMALHHGRRPVFQNGFLMVSAMGFAFWTMNRPYVGATAELMQASLLRSFKGSPAWLVSGLGMAGLLLGVLIGIIGSWNRRWAWAGRAVHCGWATALLMGMGYGLLVRPWVEGVGSGGSHAELMPIAALYLSPFLFGLAGLGAARVVLRRPAIPARWLLLIFGLSFGALFFWRYTTARVYPVALRRLMPEVLPALVLLGAWGLRWMERKKKAAVRILAGVACLWLGGVSGPYWVAPEGWGTWGVVETMAAWIPEGAVILFEPLHGDAIVGWFAAPLWSFYGRRALLVNWGVEEQHLRSAVDHWCAQGRMVYVLSQHDPAMWWPGPFSGQPVGEFQWRSSVIGQSMRFPPVLWRFDFRFTAYRVDCMTSK